MNLTAARGNLNVSAFKAFSSYGELFQKWTTLNKDS